MTYQRPILDPMRILYLNRTLNLQPSTQRQRIVDASTANEMVAVATILENCTPVAMMLLGLLIPQVPMFWHVDILA